MSGYRHPAMKAFADQLVRFANHERKLQRLAAAESLLAEIDVSREYPYQYVCYRITEFRPELYPDLVLKGEDLQHDLRKLLDEVADSAPMTAVEAGEPILTVEDLTRRYSISSKTVTRWRERGLVSRRIVLDGRKRVGFLKSSLDRFVGEHTAEVDRGSRFSQLGSGEKEEILRHARELSLAPTATLAEVSRRVGEQLGRSAETIRYTIKNYDREHPESALFPDLRGPLDEPAKLAIFNSIKRGVGIEALAQKFGRTKSSVHRIANEMRARKLLAKPLDYMKHPSFELSGAEEEILGRSEPAPERKGATAKPPAGLPPYLQSLYEVPLLNRDQEQHLFRKMNFLLHKASLLRDKIDLHHVRAGELDQIETWEEGAQEIKRRIIRANLRLVVSIAKRHVGAVNNLFELISDGNISLLRAVEKFDYSRGFKFSTYASWAIMKNFARSIPQENLRRDRFVTGQDLAFDLAPDVRSVESEVEQSHQKVRSAVQRILERLEEREREVIVDRYGLSDRTRSQTLEQVGAKFGVTKERIRQIESRAIRKLKEFAREENIDLSAFG
ncbi:MAG TPA: sigma-70 family RNA polymerase sigma factor [Planctomycetia bacterium]|nr:sigma-70 family RNA polymerase sigma factor [Planctomycetia bacterium]